MNKTPTLVGANSNDGVTFTGNYLVSNPPGETVSAYISYLNDPAIFGPMYASTALQLYPVTQDSDVRRAVADSFSDTQFDYGARGVARTMSVYVPNVYRYFFTRKAGGVGDDPVHGAELNYVNGKVSTAPYNAQDVALSMAMMDAWKRFAQTGNPNGGLITNWPPYNAATDPLLILGDTYDQVGFGYGRPNANLDFDGMVLAATKGPSTPTSPEIQARCTCSHYPVDPVTGAHPFGAVCKQPVHAVP
jgi:carboxylesterase type B